MLAKANGLRPANVAPEAGYGLVAVTKIEQDSSLVGRRPVRLTERLGHTGVALNDALACGENMPFIVRLQLLDLIVTLRQPRWTAEGTGSFARNVICLRSDAGEKQEIGVPFLIWELKPQASQRSYTVQERERMANEGLGCIHRFASRTFGFAWIHRAFSDL